MTSLVRDVNSCMDYDITGKGKECWIGSHRICVLPLTSALQLNRLIELALSTVANHIVLYPIQLVEIFVLGVGSMAEVTPFSLSFSSKSRNWAAAHFKPACRIGPVFAFVCFLFLFLICSFFFFRKQTLVVVIVPNFLAEGHFFYGSGVHCYKRNGDK